MTRDEYRDEASWEERYPPRSDGPVRIVEAAVEFHGTIIVKVRVEDGQANIDAEYLRPFAKKVIAEADLSPDVGDHEEILSAVIDEWVVPDNATVDLISVDGE